MGESFILPLIIGFIFIVIKIFKSNQILILKLLFYFMSIIGFYFTITLLIASFWEQGRDIQPVEKSDDTKEINFFNKTNQTINVIVDFEYSKNEIVKLSRINFKYNKKEVVLNLKKEESKYFQTPILSIDSKAPFPKNFNIKITDSTNKIIKAYNKDEFFNNIVTINKSRKDREYVQNNWVLVIGANR